MQGMRFSMEGICTVSLYQYAQFVDMGELWEFIHSFDDVCNRRIIWSYLSLWCCFGMNYPSLSMGESLGIMLPFRAVCSRGIMAGVILLFSVACSALIVGSCPHI